MAGQKMAGDDQRIVPIATTPAGIATLTSPAQKAWKQAQDARADVPPWPGRGVLFEPRWQCGSLQAVRARGQRQGGEKPQRRRPGAGAGQAGLQRTNASALISTVVGGSLIATMPPHKEKADVGIVLLASQPVF